MFVSLVMFAKAKKIEADLLKPPEGVTVSWSVLLLKQHLVSVLHVKLSWQRAVQTVMAVCPF